MGDCDLSLMVDFNALTNVSTSAIKAPVENTNLAKNFVRPTGVVSKTPNAIANIAVARME
jgi:hypothetical protein